MVLMTSHSACRAGSVTGSISYGRDLLTAGVIEGGDMLPEAALVKMMWVLGNKRIRKERLCLCRLISKENATGGAPMDYKTAGLTDGIEIHQRV